MIYLYYNSETQSYKIASENDLMHQMQTGIVSIIETFDMGSQRIANRICDNLNLARVLS